MKENVKLGAVILALGLAMILFLVGLVCLMAIPVGDLSLGAWTLYLLGSKVLAVVCIAVAAVLSRTATRVYTCIQ